MDIAGITYSLSQKVTKSAKASSYVSYENSDLFKNNYRDSNININDKSAEYILKLAPLADTASKMIDNVNILSKLGANELTTIALKASSSANTIISSLKASIGNYASQITSILNNPFLTDSERENQIELIEAKIKVLVDEGKTKITTLFSISEIVVSLSSTVSGLKNTGFDTSSFVLDFQKLLANVNTKPSDLSEVKNKSDINDVIKTNEKTFLGTDSQQTIQNLITETDKKIKENEEKLKNKAISPDEKKRLELELVLYRSENNLLKMLS